MDNAAMNQESSTKKNQSFSAILLAVVALAIALGAGYWLGEVVRTKKLPQNLQATVLDQARPITGFKLKDHDGKAFAAKNLKDQWSFMFFGYTHCPDVCPAALQIMKNAWPKLTADEQGKNPAKLYFVSVDPDRDSIDLLKKYTQYYNPEFIGITGEANELDKLTGQTGILYGFEDKEAESENYVVNHSAQILLFDPQGNMRAVISPPYDADTIISNYGAIRDYYGD